MTAHARKIRPEDEYPEAGHPADGRSEPEDPRILRMRELYREITEWQDKLRHIEIRGAEGKENRPEDLALHRRHNRARNEMNRLYAKKWWEVEGATGTRRLVKHQF